MSLMPDDAEARLLDGCTKLGELAEAAGAGQWEVVASQGYGLEVEVERGRVSLAGGGGDGGFGIRVVEDGRYGFAYMGNMDSAEVSVNQALDIARRSPRIEGFELAADSGSTCVEGMFDGRIEQLTAEDLLSAADDLVSISQSLCPQAVVTGGGVQAGVGVAAILTSEGIEDAGAISSHGFGVQLTIDDDGLLTSGWEGHSSRELLQAPDEVIAEAAWWASQTRNRTKAKAEVGDAPVVFTDSGFGGLFATIIPQATLGDRQARGESFWANRIGEQVLESHLSLTDDRTMTGGKNSGGRDAEGRATKRNHVVTEGCLKSSLWATRDAAEQVALGNVEYAESTSSAARDGHDGPPYPSAGNLLLSSSENPLSREVLLSEMVDGYLIGSVMGAHTANPTSGDFSVTSSHILHIEGGEIVGALAQAGISGNLPSALTAGVSLGNRPLPHGGWSGGSVYVPDILLRNGIRVNPA